VTVTTPLVRDVIEYREYQGNLVAVQNVPIRARVPGRLERMHYAPSTDVEAGDLLFEIEREPYEIAVAAAEAELEAARAVRAEREAILSRIERAYERGAATQAERIEATARARQAEAGVQATEAALREAKLNLSYTTVTSPLAGRVNRNLVDVGSLVGESEPTLLTNVVQMDPIRASFDVSEAIVLEYLKRGRDGEVDPSGPPVQMALANDPPGAWPYHGKVNYIDNQVDAGTGTIRVRAEFANPKPHRLFPGLFVRIRGPFRQIPDAVVIFENAVGTDIGGKYVLTVNASDELGKTPIELGPSAGPGQVVVASGLSAEARYVVRGLQQARPGERVEVETIAREAYGAAHGGLASPQPPEPGERPGGADHRIEPADSSESAGSSQAGRANEPAPATDRPASDRAPRDGEPSDFETDATPADPSAASAPSEQADAPTSKPTPHSTP